jgi:Na+-driven multidrug efflux pump
MIFPEVLLRPFTGGEDGAIKLALACRATRIACCCLATAGVTIVLAGYYQAIGNPLMAIILTLIRQVIVVAPMLVVLPHFWGLDGVWMAVPISDFVALAVSLVLLKRELTRLKARNLKTNSGHQHSGS